MHMFKASFAAVVFLAAGLTAFPGVAQARAEHYEFPFVVDDYNDCTDEPVHWDAYIYETLIVNESNGGRVVIGDHWRWDAIVTGPDTGHVWSTKGVLSYVERFGLDGTLTGGWLQIERSVMHGETPDTPDVRLDVHIMYAYNAAGDPVVESFQYNYTCMGQ